MQNCGMPPLCKLCRSFEPTNGRRRLLFLASTKFWAKNRTKFEWGPVCFWSSPNFRQKIGLILGKPIFILIFVLLKLFEIPAPPPRFSKSCARYCWCLLAHWRDPMSSPPRHCQNPFSLVPQLETSHLPLLSKLPSPQSLFGGTAPFSPYSLWAFPSLLPWPQSSFIFISSQDHSEGEFCL